MEEGFAQSSLECGVSCDESALVVAFSTECQGCGYRWQQRAQEAQGSSEEYRRQQAAAWEQEKAEAVENKVPSRPPTKRWLTRRFVASRAAQCVSVNARCLLV